MYKIAAIIGGLLLMAGVALAGTVSSLGAANTPSIGQTIPTASATVRQEDRAGEPERRGREAEARGRANEAGEDVRHADRATEAGDDRGRHSGRDDHGRNRGHGRHGSDD
jgi:hypothetical protein